MIFYNLGIAIYGLLVRLAVRVNRKAGLRREGLREIWERIEARVGAWEGPVVWVHAASLGEFEQGRPVIEVIRARHPGHKVLLTFFSPSGYEVRKDYPGADWVCYLPIDTPRNARRFVAIAKPQVAIFIKYEFWLNYLRQLSRRGCRTFLVSAIFNREQVFFKWYGGLFRRALRRFEHIFVQNEASQWLLQTIRVGAVTTTGDTRFDRVAAVAEAAREVPAIGQFAGGERVVVAGSTWPADEHVLLEIIKRHAGLKFVIVPHEIEADRIDKLLLNSPRPAVRYTQFDPKRDAGAQVMVVNVIGILSSIYRYGAYAYVGGGFGVGIHNTLEAAAFGIPVAFGPNYLRFREACELIELGAAMSIESADELDGWLTRLENDPAAYEQACKLSGEYVSKNRGATRKIVDYIFGQKD